MLGFGTRINEDDKRIIDTILSASGIPLEERVRLVFEYLLGKYFQQDVPTMDLESAEDTELAATLSFPATVPVEYYEEVALGKDSPPSSSGEDTNMPEPNWMERYLNKLDSEIADIKREFAAYESRIGSRIEQFLGEMRNLDRQRREDINEIKHDIREYKKSSDATTKWIIGLLFTMLGLIVTLVIGVASLLLKSN